MKPQLTNKDKYLLKVISKYMDKKIDEAFQTYDFSLLIKEQFQIVLKEQRMKKQQLIKKQGNQIIPQKKQLQSQQQFKPIKTNNNLLDHALNETANVQRQNPQALNQYKQVMDEQYFSQETEFLTEEQMIERQNNQSPQTETLQNEVSMDAMAALLGNKNMSNFAKKHPAQHGLEIHDV